MFALLFTGNIGKNIRKKEFKEYKVVNFSVAVQLGYGEKKDLIWVHCAWWNAPDKQTSLLKSGMKVWIMGLPSIDKYKNSEGKEIEGFKCRIDKLEIIDFKTSEPTEDCDSSHL